MDATGPDLPAAEHAAAPEEEETPRRGGHGAGLALLVLVLGLATAAPLLDHLWQIVAARLDLADETPPHDYLWLVLNALPELRVQLALLAVVVALFAAAFGRRGAALIAAACAVVNLGAIVQSVDPWRAAPGGHGAQLSLMTFNVNGFNAKRDAALAAIRAGGADVVVLQEAIGDWPTTLEALRPDYPHVGPADVERSRGMVVLSRYPIVGIEQHQPISEFYPYLLANLQLPGARVALISMHPPRPLRIAESIDRGVYFARVADHLRFLDGPVIVAGDLTATPWSRPFRDMVRQSGLTSAWSLSPWLSTWPSWIPFLGLPIDHVLASEEAEVVDVRVGDSGGSDHFPLIATIRLRRE